MYSLYTRGDLRKASYAGAGCFGDVLKEWSNDFRDSKMGIVMKAALIRTTFGVVAMVCVSAATAFGQCSLPGATSWNVLSGNWSLATNWSPAGVPNSSNANVCLTNGVLGMPATTNQDIGGVRAQVLQVGAYNTLNMGHGSLFFIGPSIINAGAINLTADNLFLTGDNLKLTGGGTLTLTYAAPGYSQIFGFGTTGNLPSILENVDNQIQGAGVLGLEGNTFLQNDASGIVNANVPYPGPNMLIQLNGINNAGTLEASNGGLMDIRIVPLNASASFNNTGTLEATSGGTLDVLNVVPSTSNGQPLFGPLTNDGTLKVTAGSTMVVADNLTNFSGGTLTGGTYIVKGTAGNPGTLQITSLPGSSGGQITTNAATIVLDGPTAGITDSANKNALSNFQDNMASGSFTVSGGQAFSTNPGGNGSDFTNAGNLYVADAASSFTTSGNYTQTGGATQVDGKLTATGGSVNINGGVLEGLGTVSGSVFIGANGTLSPGDPANAVSLTDPPGPIHITGNLDISGTFNEIIGGAPNTGTFGKVVVGGAVTLEAGSTLDVSLVNGFVPVGSEAFLIIDAGSPVTGQFGSGWIQFTNVDFLNNLGDTFSIDYSHEAQGEVFLDVNAPVSSGVTPEPAEFLPLAGVLGGLALWKIRRNRKTVE
jgi:hypothetical protein